MSRHISKRGNGPSLGVISCARPRCREEHTWPLSVEPPEQSFVIERNMTDVERQLRKDKRDQAWREVVSRPLPDGWVRLQYMLYTEGTSGNPDPYEFHSAHCAALYLNSLPDANGNQDPRRVRL
jgi:hypothetical protein